MFHSCYWCCFTICRTEGVFCCGLSISKQVVLSGNRGQYCDMGLLKQNFENLSCGCDVLYTLHMFSVLFWKCNVFFWGGHPGYTLIFILWDMKWKTWKVNKTVWLHCTRHCMRPLISVQCMVTRHVHDSNDVETETCLNVSGLCRGLFDHSYACWCSRIHR